MSYEKKECKFYLREHTIIIKDRSDLGFIISGDGPIDEYGKINVIHGGKFN